MINVLPLHKKVGISANAYFFKGKTWNNIKSNKFVASKNLPKLLGYVRHLINKVQPE